MWGSWTRSEAHVVLISLPAALCRNVLILLVTSSRVWVQTGGERHDVMKAVLSSHAHLSPFFTVDTTHTVTLLPNSPTFHLCLFLFPISVSSGEFDNSCPPPPPSFHLFLDYFFPTSTETEFSTTATANADIGSIKLYINLKLFKKL